jgi:transcription antitermination factor NusG
MKKNALVLNTKPLLSGLIYIKAKMCPEVADFIENQKNVYGLTKNIEGLTLPISAEEAMELDKLKAENADELDVDIMRMKKDEYVSVVSGTHAGKYGILNGIRKGRAEVFVHIQYILYYFNILILFNCSNFFFLFIYF